MAGVIPEIGRNGQVNINFNVQGMPMGAYEEFKNLAHNKYNDIYWLAIKDLMDKAKLLDLVASYESRLYKLECDTYDSLEVSEAESTPEQVTVTLGKNGINY